jgi:hypothetical protein
MEADHWAHLSAVLRQQGIVAVASELKWQPHDVVLSERLLARVGRNPGEPSDRKCWSVPKPAPRPEPSHEFDLGYRP